MATDTPMQLGIVGLGRMGSNIARRLLRDDHRPVGYNRDPAPVAALEAEGGTGAASLDELVAALDAPRAVWLMLPAGKVTEGVLGDIAERLQPGDTIIDGGNTHYADDIRRARELEDRGIAYLDCGTSGGVFGLERGFCLMIGGEESAFRRLEPIFASLAPGVAGAPRNSSKSGPEAPEEHGYLHCGPSGAGHFVKMVHNGIEYGMMQAIAEGFDILKNAGSPRLPADLRLAIDVADVAEVWRRGSGKVEEPG